MRTGAKIWYVPIEPLPERYSESWFTNVQKYFEQKLSIARVHRITGVTLTNQIEVGTFLDINSTVYYKSMQLQKIAELFHRKMIVDGDVFFFGDLEFWGLESIRLMSQMNKVHIHICGFLHAASYTREDAFSVAESYQQYTEVGWVAACDAVFVGSDYHKNALIDRRFGSLKNVASYWSKIKTTGNPMFRTDYSAFAGNRFQKKQKLIISNRFDWEKRPNVSLDFAYLLKRRNPDLQIVIATSRRGLKSNRNWLSMYAQCLEADKILTIDHSLSKLEYHTHLAESKVMLTNSIEENFGYCIAEACHFGCAPVLQRAFSHPELVQEDPELLFDTEDEIIWKVERILRGEYKKDVKKYAEPYFSSMDRIWEEIEQMTAGEF